MQESIAIILLLPILGHAVRVSNEFCRPRPTLVPIDNPEFKFFPYFVKLHQCGGSCDHIQPSVKSCIPLEDNEVSVTVQMVGTSEMRVIKVKNHTRCGCECVHGPENCDFELEEWKPDLCQCQCRNRDRPPVPCEAGKTWSKAQCRCVCNKQPQSCGPNKIWSKKACGCVCKEKKYIKCARKQKLVDEETCMCITKVMHPEAQKLSSPKPHPKGGLRQEFYIMIFIGQFVLLYSVFEAILYRKEAGLIYRITRSCLAKGAHLNSKESSEYIFSVSTSETVTNLSTETGHHHVEATVKGGQAVV